MNIKKTGTIYRNEGIKGIINRVINRIYQKTNVYSRSVHGDLPFSKRNDLQLAVMTPEMLENIIREYGSEISFEKQTILTDRLSPESNELAYVIMEAGGTILGFYCIAYGAFYDSTVEFYYPARKGNMYLIDGYTFKKHRKKGAQKFSTIARLAIAKQQGLMTVTVMARYNNEYSIKSILGSGFLKCGVVHHFNFFGMKKSIARYTL